MGKRQRKLKSAEDTEEDGRTSRTRIVASSDEEVDKYLQFHCRRRTEGAIDLVTDSKKGGKRRKTKRRKGIDDAVVVKVPEDPSDTLEDKQEKDNATDISINAFESKPGEKSENDVLRKLLRGPRYFDPPDTSWGACYNCGEEGHTTINCPSEKRRKPCYVCGSHDHIAKRCNRGLDCFICQSKTHRARDCPEKQKTSKICLKCGNSGHTMFSCRSEYSSEDLKEIRCYVCGKFGHMCCADYSDPGPREISCYRCGLSGHNGLSCKGYDSETVTVTRDNSCFNCGLRGHFSRECTSSKKAGKRKSEPSTPKQQSPMKKKFPGDIKSVPIDPSKMIRKKNPLIPVFVSAGKSKQSGGWVAEHPDDDMYRGSKRNVGFRELPHDQRSNGHYGFSTPGPPQNHFQNGFAYRGSRISTPGDHYGLSTPSPSHNYYRNGFHSSAYNDSSGFYHENGFSAPGFIQKGRRHGQW